jgi:hypothetical protein
LLLCNHWHGSAPNVKGKLAPTALAWCFQNCYELDAQ